MSRSRRWKLVFVSYGFVERSLLDAYKTKKCNIGLLFACCRLTGVALARLAAAISSETLIIILIPRNNTKQQDGVYAQRYETRLGLPPSNSTNDVASAQATALILHRCLADLTL